MTPPEIVLRGLGRSFMTVDGPVRVLADIDLKIGPGEFVAITGRSGCGKSTLLNIIGGLDRGYSGSCCIGDVELNAENDAGLAALRRRHFGFVFQHFGLVPVLTAAENVGLPAFYDGVPETTRDAEALRLLETFGVVHRAGRYPDTLSGGEQQRIAIARALINRAPVLIADEPTGSLDSTSAEIVFSMLERLHEAGHTIVLVTHDAALAERAERIVTIEDGRILRTRDGNAAPCEPVPENTSGVRQRHPVLSAPRSRLPEAVRTLARALGRRPLQSALTILGVAIGSAAVIALSTIGEGARRQVIERIEALGADLVTISRGPPGVRGAERMVTSLVPADQAAVAGLPGVAGHAPELDGVVTARYRDRDFLVTLTGTNEQLPLVRDWPIERGVFFGRDAVRSHALVAVLGATAARNLFRAESPEGRYVLIDKTPFRVIGVMQAKGVTTGPGHDRDNQIWVPHTTASSRLFGRQYIDRIVVKTEGEIDAVALAAQLRVRMLARHRIEDFSVNTLSEIIRAATSAQQTLDYFIGAIAAIALLIGGIGVMNIMLASVNERTREIGIRMAVGAARRDIRGQFLRESVALCAAGGIAGMLLGIATVQATESWGGIPTQLAPGAFGIALASAVSIGLLFGVAPASRAAAIDPAEAFRRAT